MDAAAELPAWLRALEPLSVPLVVLLTVVAVWIERRRDRERRRRYDARMRANAYELAELLHGWSVRWPGWAGKKEIRVDAHRIVSFCRTLAAETPRARELARELVTDAPAASDELAEMAREVYPRVVSTARFVEGMAEIIPQLDHGEEWERMMPAELGTYREDFVERALELLTPAIEDLRQHSRW